MSKATIWWSVGVLVASATAFGAGRASGIESYGVAWNAGREYGHGVGLTEGARNAEAQLAARALCDKASDLSQDARHRENGTPEAVAYFARCSDAANAPLCQELLRTRNATPEWRLHSDAFDMLRINCPNHYRRQYPTP